MMAWSLGCGCPCPEPATPQAPAAAAARTRPTLPPGALRQQCADTPAESTSPTIEVFADLGVIRLSADTFVDLPVQQRKLAYALAKVAQAATPIQYEQRHPQGKHIQILAEELALHLNAVPADLRPSVKTFVALVFAHKGPRDAWSDERLSFSLTRAQLETAVLAAWKAGASFPGVSSEPALRTWLSKLTPALFNDHPQVSPRKADSADAKRFEPIRQALREARPYATAAQQRLLDLQDRALDSTNPQEQRAFLDAWVSDGSSLELALSLRPGEPREASLTPQLFLVDSSATAALQEPVATFAGTTASSARWVVATPLWMGLVSPTPWATRMPDQDKTKIFQVPTAASAISHYLRGAMERAYVLDAEQKQDLLRCLGPSQKIMQMAQAAVAPASSPTLHTVARAHATAAVLASPLSFSDLFADRTCVNLLGETYLLASFFELGLEGTEEASARLTPSALILSYASQQGAIQESLREGRTQLQPSDQESWARTMAALRDETKRIIEKREEGGAEKLLTQSHESPMGRWTHQVRQQVQALGIARRFVWQPPLLIPLCHDDGSLQDVTLDEEASWIEACLQAQGRERGP